MADDDLAAMAQLLQSRLAVIRRALHAKAQNNPRQVSDHAVIRYLERVRGVDIEAVRDEIRVMAAEAKPAKDMEHHWHESGCMLVLGEKGQVITVLGEDQVEKWIGRKLLDGSRVLIEEADNG